MATRDVGRIVAEREQRERIGDRNVGESGESESGDGEAGRLQDTPSGTHKKLRLAVRGVIGGVLFLAVLACATFSKLTLVGLTNQLRELTVELTVNGTHLEVHEDHRDITRLYWQLVFILVLPQCVTFLRCAVVGFIGKTRQSYPWPRKNALIAGAFSSFFEVLALSVFVFSVLCYLTPELALLSMQAVFIFQFVWDIYYTPCSRCRCSGYSNVDEENQAESRIERWRSKSRSFFGVLLENKTMKFVAILLQISGVAGLVVFVAAEAKVKSDIWHVPVIALPLSIVTLSFLWSNKVQEFLVVAERGTDFSPLNNARYKANFLNSLYRILLYPLVAYAVFRAVHNNINPWSGSYHHFLGTGKHLSFFLTQVLTSFFGYGFAWTACIMTLRTIGFAFPLLLSTPISLIIAEYSHFIPHEHLIKHYYYVGPCIWLAIYVGQVVGMAYFVCTKNNLILSQDKDMFINPHYDSVFLEQYLMLNRQVDKYSGVTDFTPEGQLTVPRAIFICSTMFRENVHEMRQMLKSIKRMSEWYTTQEREGGNRNKDLIESHIFFDGALDGGQLTQYPLQLLSLVNDCLGRSVVNCLRKKEPYGQSMSWDIGLRAMRFTVHFKDNFKVKNKKRWSQVMYMNYVINHRIPESKKTSNPLNYEHTYILTTDADIEFTAESAMILLDTLASNREVGAVCARTHPKGSGAMYWYQIFDYAIGHWLLKPAEHMFGCVLCCPGCFSVFRCKALKEVLKEYSTDVVGASDFLTKDMGEDRWLCTLLIQKGYRLDYCSISEDHTYCPETFDEFYKQRRRWVPSTIANLLLLMSKSSKITNANNSVSILFVLFQAIMAFSTAISPATVILIIASGLQGAYKISNASVVATIVILFLLSVFYGLVCLYTSQKTQLDLAKFLTFVFAIIMAVVFVGIIKQIISETFPVDNGARLLDPPICRNGSNTGCSIARNNLEVAGNFSTHLSSVRLPRSPTTWYLALFGFVFTGGAVLHLKEWTCLVHFVWYLLALPSGYLLLLIYSAANLNSQSWGTREGGTKGGGGFGMTKVWFRKGLITIRDFLCGKKTGVTDEQKVPLLKEESETETSDEEEILDYPVVVHKKMDEDAKAWLKDQECLEDKEKFEEHGYWNLKYIASMGREEFRAIGIEKQGFVLRLEKAAKKLPTMVIETEVPISIAEWLERLEMDEYTDVFHRAGYKTAEDVENLKELDKKELNKMGIVKMAHVQRLRKALDSLFHPTAVEVQIYQAKKDVNGMIYTSSKGTAEVKFWEDILSRELKPVTVRLQQTSKEIGQKLKSLRNATLALILLINIMWIVLLFTVTFPQLEKYDLPDRAFQLLFLAVYGVIIAVSFVAMLAHRFLMLIQFIGRPEVVKEAVRPNHEEMTVLSNVYVNNPTDV